MKINQNIHCKVLTGARGVHRTQETTLLQIDVLQYNPQ